MKVIESNLINPKPRGQHQKRVKRALISTFFKPYTTTHKISDNVYAWFTCGQIQVYQNKVLVRNI